MKEKSERLKRLSAQGMSLEELIRCVMSADPKPLWEKEKQKRKEKEEKKSKKEKTKAAK
ncbi:MAG: hypothetical protein ACLQPD_10475 [Desulfomonilaceae bacterium]